MTTEMSILCFSIGVGPLAGMLTCLLSITFDWPWAKFESILFKLLRCWLWFVFLVICYYNIIEFVL
jgi:hypothetical protein